jgi:hypothetical protein
MKIVDLSRLSLLKRTDPVVANILTHERLYLLGDFNARVGADLKDWPTAFGTHVPSRINLIPKKLHHSKSKGKNMHKHMQY